MLVVSPYLCQIYMAYTFSHTLSQSDLGGEKKEEKNILTLKVP
jgi:hypothetical protein